MSIERKIIFYTGNKGKFNEINNEFKHLGLLTKSNDKKYHYTLEQANIDIPEIQSTLNEEVVKHKLNWILNNKLTVSELKNVSIMVEDTGLYITDNIMNGFPGALVKYYLDHLGNEGICKKNANSSADAITYIGFWDSLLQKEVYFKGIVSGKISDKPSGNNGFGYDPAFVPLFLNDYEYYNSSTENIIIRKSNINNYTFADLDDNEKSQTNMRTICASKLCNYILNNDKHYK